MRGAGRALYPPPVRVVIAPGPFPAFGAAAAADAIAAGWRRAAPHDDLVLLPVGEGGAVDPALDAALDAAGLAVTGEGSFDWRSLRGSAVTAVARAAAARAVPCVVLAGQVSVGRREAAAAGVDAAYEAGAVDEAPAGSLAALAEKVARRWSR